MNPFKLRPFQDPLKEGVKLVASYRRNKSMETLHKVHCLQLARSYALISGRTEDAKRFQREMEDILIAAYTKFISDKLKTDMESSGPGPYSASVENECKYGKYGNL